MANDPSTALESPDGSWEAMLRARPLQNIAARLERFDDGFLRVRVTREKPWYMVPPLSWIVPLGKERQLTLDPIGSEVFDLCDGDRDVEALVEIFAERHSLTFHESRAAVTTYLKTLLRRGVLAIALPEPPGEQQDEKE